MRYEFSIERASSLQIKVQVHDSIHGMDEWFLFSNDDFNALREEIDRFYRNDTKPQGVEVDFSKAKAPTPDWFDVGSES